MRKEIRPDISPCCALCEHAEFRDGSEDSIFCCKKRREKEAGDSCRKFVFDILKYKPARPRELPALDPSLLELI